METTTADNPIRESEKLFAETPPGRLFMRAALPGALGMLVSSSYEIVDAIFIGTFLGETAFAALHLSIPIIIVGFALGDLIGSGSAVPISISLGKGDYEHANEVFSFACVLNVVTGAIMGLLLFLGADAMMALMGADGEFAALGAIYLRVFSFFLPVTTITYSVDNFLRICGHIRRSFFVNVSMAVTGALLELLFMGVFHWGLWSAALGYSLAMIISVIVAFWPFFQGRMLLKFTMPKPSLDMFAEIVKYGMPVFLDTTSSRIFSIIMNTALVRLGGEMAVSVYGIIMTVQSVFIMLIYGMIDAMQPAVGYNWGARALQRVKALEKYCFAVSALIGVAGFAVVRLIPELMVHLFLPSAEGEFVVLAVHALGLFSWSLLIKWFSFSTQAFMVAVGQVRLASFVSVAMVCIFPLAALFALWPLGLDGLWLNSTVTFVLCAIMSAAVLLRFRRTVRERLERA